MLRRRVRRRVSKEGSKEGSQPQKLRHGVKNARCSPKEGPTIRVKIIKIKKSGLLIICIETWRCPEVYLNAEV
jgi:hypothetical protein